MESKHTKGKWTANLFMNEASIYCPESKQGIAKLKYADFDYDEDKVIDNAIHIVKCVNAHDELTECINELLNSIWVAFEEYEPPTFNDPLSPAIEKAKELLKKLNYEKSI